MIPDRTARNCWYQNKAKAIIATVVAWSKRGVGMLRYQLEHPLTRARTNWDSASSRRVAFVGSNLGTRRPWGSGSNGRVNLEPRWAVRTRTAPRNRLGPIVRPDPVRRLQNDDESKLSTSLGWESGWNNSESLPRSTVSSRRGGAILAQVWRSHLTFCFLKRDHSRGPANSS